MNRIVRVVDGVRDLAVWLSPAFGNGAGNGPLVGSDSGSAASSRPAPANPAAPNAAYRNVHTGGVSVTDVSVLGGPTL